jgi:hypothetical protein
VHHLLEGAPGVPAGPAGEFAQLVQHPGLLRFEALAYLLAICLVTALRSSIERPTAPLPSRGRQARVKRGPFEDILR